VQIAWYCKIATFLGTGVQNRQAEIPMDFQTWFR